MKDYHIRRDKLGYFPYPIAVGNQIINRPFNKRGPRLVAVGRVDDNRKNFPLLIEAYNLLVKKYPESSLKIVGEVSENSKVLRKCNKLNLNSSVRFLGKIGSDQLAKEYEDADIFVLTPRQEGLGIVYLEAMSYGLPVVTTRCGGPEGIIMNGQNGYLADQNDTKAFSDAVSLVWQSRDSYVRLSESAREYILRNHNPDRFRKQFIEMLKENLD
jgi:glycosyltransferase involved in cell wall biosynthesis